MKEDDGALTDFSKPVLTIGGVFTRAGIAAGYLVGLGILDPHDAQQMTVKLLDKMGPGVGMLDPVPREWFPH